MDANRNVHKDVSQVEECEHDNSQATDHNHEIDAVGTQVQCNKCSGWGHFARDCPSKGKGKGGGKTGTIKGG